MLYKNFLLTFARVLGSCEYLSHRMVQLLTYFVTEIILLCLFLLVLIKVATFFSFVVSLTILIIVHDCIAIVDQIIDLLIVR